MKSTVHVALFLPDDRDEVVKNENNRRLILITLYCYKVTFKSQAASSWLHETDNASIVCSVSVTKEFASFRILSTSRSEAFADETCISTLQNNG